MHACLFVALLFVGLFMCIYRLNHFIAIFTRSFNHARHSSFIYCVSILSLGNSVCCFLYIFLKNLLFFKLIYDIPIVNSFILSWHLKAHIFALVSGVPSTRLDVYELTCIVLRIVS